MKKQFPSAYEAINTGVKAFNAVQDVLLITGLLLATYGRVYQAVGLMTNNEKLLYEGRQYLLLANNPLYLFSDQTSFQKESHGVFDPTIKLDTSIEPDKLIQGHDPQNPIFTPSDIPNEYDYVLDLIKNK